MKKASSGTRPIGSATVGTIVGTGVSKAHEPVERLEVSEAVQLLESAAGVLKTGIAAAAHIGRTFTFVEDLREPGMDAVLSPQRYIERMNLDIGTFAQNAHVHRNTVSRAPAAGSVQKHLRENVKVIKAAFDASGGDLAKSIHWFRNEPLSPFGYRTAEELVADGRAQDVIRLIQSYDAGAAG